MLASRASKPAVVAVPSTRHGETEISPNSWPVTTSPSIDVHHNDEEKKEEPVSTSATTSTADGISSTNTTTPVIMESVPTDIHKKVLDVRNVAIPFDADSPHIVDSKADSEIVSTMYGVVASNASRSFGYPINYDFDYSELKDFFGVHLNNLGDPFVFSTLTTCTREIEIPLLDFFSRLWKFAPDSYWGYSTASGTEGNFQGLLMARERFPNGILYTSREAHYSVFKASRFFKIECKILPSTANGEMDYDALAAAIAKNPDRSVIVCANIGTTFKGAVDDIDKIAAVVNKAGIAPDDYHLHLDGALSGIIVPFVKGVSEINFATKPLDSIAVSGYKFIGTPTQCGICMCRKEHMEALNNYVEYIGSFDNTIMGSRSGLMPMFMWYALRKKGLPGLQADVDQCFDTCRYLQQKLRANGFVAQVHPFGTTVCFEKPKDDKLIKRWSLSCQDGMAHVIAMQNVTRDKVDLFMSELIESTNKHGRMDPNDLNPCLLEEW